MTDNEFIRIAENCCSDKPNCTCCPFDVGTNTVDECMEKLIQHCVDLINRQKAEIERLQAERKEYILPVINKGVKVFADKLKSIYVGFDELHEEIRYDNLILAIDSLVKEMCGENNV